MDDTAQPVWRPFGVFAIISEAILHRLDGIRHAWRVRQAAAELHAFSDYELKDIGLARCEIDYRLRHPHER